MSPAVVVIFVYLMVQIRTSTCLTQVEIACPIFTSTFSGNGALPFHGPAFEAAVKECNRIYAGVFNFTITFITAATVEETIDNFAGNIARWYLDPKRSSDIGAIISPGSTDPTLVHQLTSHWNILCLSTTVARKSEYNLRPATTMIAATFVSLPSIATTLTTLLSSHGWITVFLVIDRGSVAAYYSLADELDRTNKTVPPIRYLKRNIVAKNLRSFDQLLREFKLESRVMLFLGHADFLRRLMVDAASLNMTNGEFVYICDEPLTNPRTYGDIQWQQPGEDAPNQLAAREAFRSLLIVQPYELTDFSLSNKSDELGRRFRVRSKELYNVTLTAADQGLPIILASYTNVFMFAQVLNETLATYGEARLRDGKWLSERFLNRAFISPGGLSDVYVNENGFRQAPQSIAHFEGENSTREIIFIQSNEYGPDLQLVRNISTTWPGGMWPPPNEPICGYTGMKKACRESGTGFLQRGGLTGLLTLVCILTILAMIACARSYLLRARSREREWRLDHLKLTLPNHDRFTTRNLSVMMTKLFT